MLKLLLAFPYPDLSLNSKVLLISFVLLVKDVDEVLPYSILTFGQ